MSDTSQPLPTFANLITMAEALSVEQNGTDQIMEVLTEIRDGLNAVNYAANTTLASALGQISDQVAAVNASVNARTDAVNAQFSNIEQRINTMSDNIVSGVATLKADFASLAGVVTSMHDGLTAFETQFAATLADLTTRGAVDAAAAADLAALHQMAVDLQSKLATDVAAIPSAPPVAPPADPAPEPAPAPTGSTGDTGSTASAPTGDTGATAAAPTGATA